MKKDPNRPRGKSSAYAFFVQECRNEHKKKHPGTSVVFTEFSRKCSERWKTMSSTEKGKFDEMAKKDKVRYDREMKSYVPPKGAKQGKKKKDPNAPKRPPSAFFVFCADHRSKIKEDNPGISIGDIAKKLGEMWATQTAKDKAPYEAKASKLKEKYEKDMAAYRAKGGSAKGDGVKKGKPGRPAKKTEPEEEDEDEDEEDEDEEEDDDEEEEEEEDDD